MIKYLVVLVALLASQNAHGITITGRNPKVEIRSERVAHLDGAVGPRLVANFEKEMIETAGRPGDRIILINSPGGLVDSGKRLIAMIEAEKKLGVRVVCVVTRSAMSMAFNFLTRCDVRLAVPKAVLLFHRIAVELPCETDRFTSKVLRDLADGLDRDDQEFREANSKALGMSLADYDLFTNHETYWRAETLLAKRYLHGIVLVTP